MDITGKDGSRELKMRLEWGGPEGNSKEGDSDGLMEIEEGGLLVPIHLVKDSWGGKRMQTQI